MSLVPNYPTDRYLAFDPPRPLHCVMTVLEPQVVVDVPPNVEGNSTTTAVLNADIRILTAFKDIVETAPGKGVFESAIVILTLIRVRLLVLLRSCTHSSVVRPGRDKGRSARRAGEGLR